MTNFIRGLKFREKMLILYVIFIPVMRAPSLPILSDKIQISDIIFLGFLISCLKDLFKLVRYSLSQPEVKVSLMFAFAVLVSALIKKVSLNSFIEFSKIIYLLLVFMLSMSIVRNREIFWVVIKTWTIVSVIVALIGLITLTISYLIKSYHINPFIICQQQLSSIIFIPRVTSTFRNPNMFLTYLHLGLGFAVLLCLVEKRRVDKIVLGVAIGVIFIAMLCTGSRHIVGVILTLFVINHFISKITGQHNFIYYFLGFIFIIVLIFVFLTARWTIYPVKFEKNDSIRQLNVSVTLADSIYFIQHLAALKMTKDNPFIGVGLGNFPEKFVKYTDWDKYKLTFDIENVDRIFKSDPHSTYLGVLAETGIIGLLPLLVFFYLVVKNLLLEYKLCVNNMAYRYSLVCFFAINIGFLLNAFIIDILTMRHLWVFLALCVAQRNILRK